MASVRVNDITLNVLDEGAGAPVLLVHGFPLDHTMWLAQIHDLAKDYRVIAPDLQGFGNSDVVADSVTMEQFADDLDALLTVLDVQQPVTLCGLSMGGYIAWQFARKFPQRLRSLILCDTRADADSAEGIEARNKLARLVQEKGSTVAANALLPKLFAPQTAQDNPAVIESTQQVILGTTPRGIAAGLSGMAQRPDVTDWLPSIAVPTLVLVGEHDLISPPETMHAIAERIPGSVYHVVPNAGHMAPLENPENVNAAIRQFLLGVHPADANA